MVGSTAEGTARLGRKTKDLVGSLTQEDIAVIGHADIDEVCARAIVAKRPRMVINADKSITGRYQCQGPAILLAAGIPVLDDVGFSVFDRIHDGDRIEVRGCHVFLGDELVAEGTPLTPSLVGDMYAVAEENLGRELERFVENTLEYAIREKEIILGGVETPLIDTPIRGRHCLIAVRGPTYREDLAAVDSYIRETRPVLIGVDGGADALMEQGFVPDLIIGDMDSVSERALRSGAELIAHAYPDGSSPGAERLSGLGLPHKVFRSPGTSEDIAMLLAYDKGASLLVALGAHSSMLDFLEKGRPGMGSTFLVRLKVGSILVDAKGVSQLYRGKLRLGHIAGVVVAATVPLVVLSVFSGAFAGLARLLVLRLKVMLGLL
ncbi:MAG: putative cytokinetic ring protein SteA [Firmicutes bacterium]|jgi:uncharacterized membrane-anchored protein|nr:putative cytokinetic ring protein SteA [Bacillota bacterium]